MHLLQATWSTNGEFFVWGEDAKRYSGQTQELTNGSTSTHPFASTAEELSNEFERLEFEADGCKTINLSLPIVDSKPCSSPKLVPDDNFELTSDTSLGTWQLSALYLEPLPALSFLTSIPQELPQGLRLDDSFTYWIEATKLVLDLLARGRFLPGMSQRNGVFSSFWHPVFSEENDHERLSVLATEMPPICRALTGQQSATPEPSELLESFMSQTTDSLIRSFLRSFSLTNPPEDSDSLTAKTPTSKTITIHSWLTSLTSNDSVVSAPDYDLLTLESKLKSWSGNFLTPTRKHDLRTCFRLSPPSNQSSEDVNSSLWAIDFIIQSVHDSSQFITAPELWSGNLGFLQNTEHTVEELEQQLLVDLARASYVLPLFKSALLESHPNNLEISVEEAYQFLREAPKLLEPLNVQIILPGWWKNPTSKFGLHLDVSSAQRPSSAGTKTEFLGTYELLDYNWNLALGDKKLSVEEFKKLAAEKNPLVQVDGTWIELQPEKVEATLRFLTQHEQKQKLSVFEALRFGLGIENDSESYPVVGFNAVGWIEQLINSSNHSVPILEQPENFTGSLRPYQSEGFSWLSFLSQTGIGGCLADDMGLGKTIQFLALLVHEHNELARIKKDTGTKITHEPTLLVVPMSILDNWEREATRFAPNLTTYIHHGPQRLMDSEFMEKVAKTNIVITTYSLAHRDEALISKVNWRRITLDEAQNIKNTATKQTQAIRRLGRAQLENPTRVSVCQRVALTGTPLENHLEELWSIFDFLNPGFLGSVNDFRTKFAIPIERYRNSDVATSLAKIVQPFILRRLKTDSKVIQDLPEKIDIEVFTNLSPEQATLYQQSLDAMLDQVDGATGMHRKGLVLSTITKLKQICNHPALFLKDNSELGSRSSKLNRLVELLEVIIAEGDRVLIFTQYAQMGHLLKPFLQDRFNQEVLYLHGSLSRKARERLIDRFQTEKGPQIFILSLKAGGFGLNLTQANQVIHYDQWWNPAVQDQATDRAYRIGQKRNVQVRTFICKGTLEEKIHQMLQHKKELANEIVGSSKNFITQLSTDELRELLSLAGGTGLQDDE